MTALTDEEKNVVEDCESMMRGTGRYDAFYGSRIEALLPIIRRLDTELTAARRPRSIFCGHCKQVAPWSIDNVNECPQCGKSCIRFAEDGG